MPWFYYGGRILTRFVLLFARWQVSGKENIPASGPLLIVANHLSVTDPPVISVSIRRKMVFMAKEELFRSPLSAYFIRTFGAFPVYRRRADRDAIRQAREVLEQGQALVMFPEGKRSKDLKLQQGSRGPALLAAQCGVPILPVGLTGTERIHGVAWLPSRPRITVNIGRPFRLAPADGKLSKAQLDEFTATIMARIAELLPARYGGQLENH